MTSFDRRTFLKATGAGVALAAAAGETAGDHERQLNTVEAEVVDTYLTDPEHDGHDH